MNTTLLVTKLAYHFNPPAIAAPKKSSGGSISDFFSTPNFGMWEGAAPLIRLIFGTLTALAVVAAIVFLGLGVVQLALSGGNQDRHAVAVSRMRDAVMALGFALLFYGLLKFGIKWIEMMAHSLS